MIERSAAPGVGVTVKSNSTQKASFLILKLFHTQKLSLDGFSSKLLEDLLPTLDGWLNFI
jgi:hypothetical protein